MAGAQNIEELLRVVTIDKKRKVKMIIQLRDKDNDEIPIREAVEKLTQYVTDNLSSEGENVCKQQIMPLMAQAVVSGLNKLMGAPACLYMMSHEHIRYGLVDMMTVAFYLLKWLQQKEIKICTAEESITDEDIATYDRISIANDATVQYMSAGGDPKELIREMVKRGLLKSSDLSSLGEEDISLELEDKDKN